MELSKKLIDAKSSEYLEDEDDVQLEKRLLETLPQSFATGSVAIEDVYDIIEWKANRNRNDFKISNDSENVLAAVDIVTQSIPTSLKINILSTLNWVQVPTATAILMFVNPQKYTVIDERAWRILHETSELTHGEKNQDTFDEKDYEQYLSICHQISARLNRDLRTLDRALFRIDKTGPEILPKYSDE